MKSNSLKIRFQVFKHIIDHCDFFNIARSDLLKVAGLEESFFEKNEAYISLDVFEDVVTFIYERSDDPLLLLNFFSKNDISSTGPVSLLVTLSQNLKEAIHTFYKYKELNGELANMMQIEEKDSYIYFKWVSKSNNSNFVRWVTEYKCAWWVGFVKLIGSDGYNHIKYVSFKHDVLNMRVQDYYKRFFECPVYFGEKESMLVVSKEALELPLRTANRELYLNIENHILNLISQYKNNITIRNKVKLIINSQLREGVVNREVVANKLGVNIRTLTRKLNQEGCKYSLILDEVRLEEAKNYLRTSDLTILNISKCLGFYTSNAFISWFKVLTGETPKRYREL